MGIWRNKAKRVHSRKGKTKGGFTMLEIDINDKGIVLFANGGYTYLPIGLIESRELE